MTARATPAPVAAVPSFDDAAAYERFMGRWSRLLAPAFVDFASASPAESVLDVGCGTGALVDELSARWAECRITGIDASDAFVAACRARLPPPRHRFYRADASSLPFADASFGATLSLLVLMLLQDPASAAAEMKRVTQPGGTVAACTWDADRMELISVVWEEIRALDANAPWREGRTHCAHPGALGALWRTTGLDDVHESAIDVTLRYTCFEDCWEPLASGVGPAGAYVACAPGSLRLQLKDRLRRRLADGRDDAPFDLGARALAVRGRVS